MGLLSAAMIAAFSEPAREAPAAYAFADEARPGGGMLLGAANRIAEATTARVVPEWEGRRDVLEWREGEAIEWEANVTETSAYRLSIGYFPLEGNGQDIEFLLSVNGRPFAEDNEPFKLHRVWRDEGGALRQNRGNDLRPRQLEERLWLHTGIVVPGDLQGERLAIELPAGKHRIRIDSVRDGAVIDYVLLSKAEPPISYEEYLQSAPSQAESSKVPHDAMTVVQAEQAYLKSSSGLFPTMDRTSPLTRPYHPVKLRINTIGGSNWDTPGQWISWRLAVPEDGWYKIGFRYHQNKVKGSFVSRRVYLDGRVPFAALHQVRFPYGLNWSVKELGDETGEPYRFYLTKGAHELRMEVTLGEMAPSIEAVRDITKELQRIYRQIVMITGVRPDPYRDYELEKSIPELLPDLEKQLSRMQEEAERLRSLAGGDNSGTRALELLIRQANGFIDRPDTIPKRLDSFKTNMTGLADWMLNVSHQPLELDYVYAAAPSAETPKAEAGFASKAVHELRAFAGSFLEDYDSLGGEAERQRSIDVWTGLGRDQAYVVKRLIDETFTPETGIHVNFNLVENALVVAVMAGEGPDVSLLTNRGDAMNLAIRGALAPLDAFDDFDEATKPYLPSAFTPYKYKGHTYAIPDEQEFFMMFVREDILKDLGVEPPETWEELLSIAPVLQNRHLQIGLPYEDLDAYQLLARGMGTLNLFPSLLMQNGSGVYNEEQTKTRFDEQEAYKAFKQWTDFYMLYDYPLYKDTFNRFRSGEMPIVIDTYKLYNRLVKAAPEMTGTWRMYPIPGIRKDDGTIDRATAATGKASIILKDASNMEDAWTFVKWWNQADIQSRFAKELESELGVLGRRTPANLDAFESTNWSRAEQDVLMEQWLQVREIPELPGGYYTSRNIDNAFRRVIFGMENPRESLFYWNKQINEELARKRYEFGVSEVNER